MMMMMMMMMMQFQTILAVTGFQGDLKTCAPIKRGKKKSALASSQRSSLRGSILARRGSPKIEIVTLPLIGATLVSPPLLGCYSRCAALFFASGYSVFPLV